jgi:hypothetical protein
MPEAHASATLHDPTPRAVAEDQARRPTEPSLTQHLMSSAMLASILYFSWELQRPDQ